MKLAVHAAMIAVIISTLGCADESLNETGATDPPPSETLPHGVTEMPQDTATKPSQPARSAPTDEEIRERMQRPEDDSIAEFAGLRTTKPVTWLWQPPIIQFRTANYTVPGTAGGDSVELVITAFQEGDGGPIQGNIDRWVSQFRSPGREPVTPIIEEIEVSGLPITLVELSGEWRKMGSPSFDKDQLFLGAIIERPEGNVFIRLAGDAPTVEANRERFREFIENIEVVSETPDS